MYADCLDWHVVLRKSTYAVSRTRGFHDPWWNSDRTVAYMQWPLQRARIAEEIRCLRGPVLSHQLATIPIWMSFCSRPKALSYLAVPRCRAAIPMISEFGPTQYT
jgi:hypothetical protein